MFCNWPIRLWRVINRKMNLEQPKISQSLKNIRQVASEGLLMLMQIIKILRGQALEASKQNSSPLAPIKILFSLRDVWRRGQKLKKIKKIVSSLQYELKAIWLHKVAFYFTSGYPFALLFLGATKNCNLKALFNLKK